jgi:ubiquinone/menaquinone biosynthesis C-methylase UbiE
MKRRVRRIVVAAATFVIAVPLALGGLAWWFEWGPGFRRQCDDLATLAAIRPGMAIADVGAGDGRVAWPIATRLGPAGRLYATEVSDARLEEIKRRVAAERLTNVIPVKGGVSTTGLTVNCCDVIYLRRVYHHLDESRAIAEGIFSSLRPRGLLVIIDMQTPAWLPQSFQHGIRPAVIRNEIEPAGFQLERQIAWWSPIDYCLIFRKKA